VFVKIPYPMQGGENARKRRLCLQGESNYTIRTMIHPVKQKRIWR